MVQAKDFSINKKRLMEHLAEFFLELRNLKIHCERCYGTDFCIKLNKPRTLISVDELISYIDYKAKEFSREDLIDLELDQAIRKWVKKTTYSGIHSISFNKEEASKNANTTYFYEIFSHS